MNAVVVGGGFYGCCLASFLRRHGHQVTLVEKGEVLLGRASYVNQARVHNGYHYPRSLLTALRAAFNFTRFIVDFRGAVRADFRKYYAIARQSKVNAYQFAVVCGRIGSPQRAAPESVQRMFSEDLIEAVFAVEEHAFDAQELRRILGERLVGEGVDVRLGCELVGLRRNGRGIDAALANGAVLTVDAVFNCTYSQINQVLRKAGVAPLRMKHEITEMAMIEPPGELRGMGVTVMDGPFFSTMPFPPLGLHSLSHVRYTPHESWLEPEDGRDPHDWLEGLRPESRATHMLRDAQRYLPAIGRSKWVRSLFEVKTVLRENEVDDGRPILLRWHPELGMAASIMGGKIDNIYDVLEALERLGTVAASPETAMQQAVMQEAAIEEGIEAGRA